VAAPWILSFAIPLGAVAAIVRYRRWRAGIGAEQSMVTPMTQATTG